jgi:alkanesulfonate monooxygenase SsuD/methylene tetrahydromethanopterin reductase-like flavin-dependent oxidoreductase (luciferase family)
VFGIGAAWNRDEHVGYGFDFPPIGERMDRLDEALRIATLMFREDRPSFSGRHHRIESVLNVPRPIQAGGPRILVGGGGERRTLRLVARYADMSNWFGDLETLKHKDEVLQRHCQAEGRDPSTILRTIMAPVLLVTDESQARAMLDRLSPERRAVVGEPALPEQAAERLRPYLEAGFTGFTFRNPNLRTPELLAAAGEVKKLLS